MRSVRALWTALAVVAVLPAVGAAQSGKPFKDAWFWGIKAGGLAYGELATNFTSSYKQAPSFGADWLITRTHGGLYVSYSQAFLTTTQYVAASASDTVGQPVALKNLRRVDLAAMGFPGDNPILHPYVGIGVSLKQVVDADAGPNETAYEARTIQLYRTGFSPFLILGGQFRLRVISAFVQATASPAQKNMFLYNGKSFHLGYEFGLRYNGGTSIERE